MNGVSVEREKVRRRRSRCDDDDDGVFGKYGEEEIDGGVVEYDALCSCTCAYLRCFDGPPGRQLKINK